MVLFIIVLSYFSPYYSGLTKTVVQSVMYGKFMIMFLTLHYMVSEKVFYDFMRFMFFFTLLGFFINVIVGEIFFDFIGSRVFERNGIYRYVGFQGSANVFSLASCVLIFYSLCNDRGITKVLSNVVLVACVFASGSHTGIVLLLLVYFLYAVIYTRIFKFYALPILLLLVAMLPFTGVFDKISVISDRYADGNDSGYSRTVVIFNALKIAIDNYPYGGGAASYATPLSRDSDIYRDYGMDKVTVIKWFLSGSEKNSGIYDTSFGMLIGELGFIGAALFLMINFLGII